jgi:CelD/BcsL family acetyltransferase involved in cellulose biosynthesis
VIRREAGFSPERTLGRCCSKSNHEKFYQHHPREEAGDTVSITVMRDGRKSMVETVARERSERFFRAHIEGTLFSGAFIPCYTCDNGAVHPVIGKEHK